MKIDNGERMNRKGESMEKLRKRKQMKRTEKSTVDAERHRRKEINMIGTEQTKEEVEIKDQDCKKNIETIETAVESGQGIVEEAGEIKVRGNMKETKEIKNTETRNERKEHIMSFNLLQVEILKRRNKAKDPCISDDLNFDQTIFIKNSVYLGRRHLDLPLITLTNLQKIRCRLFTTRGRPGLYPGNLSFLLRSRDTVDEIKNDQEECQSHE